MTSAKILGQAFDALLEPEKFRDYGPNGLQVEGRRPVRKLVSGVTASLALIEAAVAQDADAILVHHGLFWRGHDGCVTGWMRQRLALLLAHDIHLFAYHLPLDAHEEWGNNAQLGQRLINGAAKKLADWASSKDAMLLYGKNFAITAQPGVAATPPPIAAVPSLEGRINDSGCAGTGMVPASIWHKAP